MDLTASGPLDRGGEEKVPEDLRRECAGNLSRAKRGENNEFSGFPGRTIDWKIFFLFPTMH
jgi:hypothetical protein